MRVTVYKRDERGMVTLHYQGEITARAETWVVLEARMGRDVPTDYVHFRKGDRMTEYFYSDRWYNIFRIEDIDSQQLKGWYCNITRPAYFSDGDDGAIVTADDLALDVFIAPDGALRVLDEDEFIAIDIPDVERAACLAAVEQVRALSVAKTAPFHEIM